MYIFNILFTLSMVLLSIAEWSHIYIALTLYMVFILIISISVIWRPLFTPETPLDLGRCESLNPIIIMLSMFQSLIIAGVVIYTGITWLTHLMIAYMILYNVGLIHFWRCQIAWVKHSRMETEANLEQARQETKVGS